MSQRIATAKPGQPAPDPSVALEGLGRGWLILRNCRLGGLQGGGLPAALIHPAVGVALLDILPAESPRAVEAFRTRLVAARFPAIFPGHLPVVHLRLAPCQLGELRLRLEQAFAVQPPLSLPGGDAWIAAVARALTTEPPVPRLRSRRIHQRHRRRFAPWRLAGAAALAAGALVAVYAATGPRQLTTPATEARLAASAAASGMGEAVLPTAQDIPAPPLVPPAEAATAPAPSKVEPAMPPAPVAPAQLPVLPVPSEGQKVAAPPPPARPASEQAARAGAAGLALTPRLAPIARHPDPAPPQPERAGPPDRASDPRHAPPAPVPEPRRLPPIAAQALPPIAGRVATQPPLEPPQQRCHRIVWLVGQGVLLPEEDLRFFQRSCIRH